MSSIAHPRAPLLDSSRLLGIADDRYLEDYGKDLKVSEIIHYSKTSVLLAKKLLGDQVDKVLDCLDLEFDAKLDLLEEYLVPDAKRIYAIASHVLTINTGVCHVAPEPKCQQIKDLAQQIQQIYSYESWSLEAFEDIKEDRDAIVLIARKNPLKFASDNPNFKLGVLVAIGYAKQRAHEIMAVISSTLKDDEEIAHLACSLSPSSFEFVSERLRAQRELVEKVLPKKGLLLQHTSDELKDNEEVVCLALQNTGDALRFASRRLRSTREIVLKAVTKTPLALQYAASNLLIDDELLDLHLNRERY